MTLNSTDTTTTISSGDSLELLKSAQSARGVAFLGILSLVLTLLFIFIVGLFLKRDGTLDPDPALAPADPPFFAAVGAITALVSAGILLIPFLNLLRSANGIIKALNGAFDPARFSAAIRSQRAFFGQAVKLAILIVLGQVLLVVSLLIVYAALSA